MRYAGKGIPVFPCNPESKAPMVPGGFKAATTDAGQVTLWWRKWPHAMIGRPTGGASHLVVIDVDPRNGGDEANLSEVLPVTLCVNTPSGGRHWYFTAPDGAEIRSNNDGKLAVGIDVKANGGYVIAPPSVNSNGKAYAWANEGTPMAELPGWIIDALAKPKRIERPPVPTTPPPTFNGMDGYSRAALDGILNEMRTAPEGARNHTLNKLAYRLGQLQAGGVLPADSIEYLIDAAMGAGLPRDEAEKTAQSGFSEGLKHPASKPERQRANDAAPVVSSAHHGQNSTADDQRAEPEPLRRPTPQPDPYPMDELGPILAPAAHALRRVIQAPDAIVGGALLAAASLATQAHAVIVTDSLRIPPSLWLLSMLDSGGRKSAVDVAVMRAAREYERELSAQYDVDAVAHAAAVEQWNARREAAKQAAKKAKGNGLADALENIGKQPPAPLIPRVIVADITAEGLFKLLDAGYPSVGAFTDEAAQVFGGHGMSKENIMRTAGALCRLWDRGELDRVRVCDGAQKFHGRRLAMHLMAQPIIAERVLSDDVLAGQGFLARCLLAWPDSTAGTRMYVAESVRDDPAMQRLHRVLLDLHRRDLPLADGSRQELDPPELRLTADAFNYWRDLHDTVERGLGPSGPFAQVQPWASKTPEQALRIAGVLTLIENPQAQHIEVGTMQRAGELALWHLGEAVRLVGMAETPQAIRDAEALLSWCHATGRKHLCSNHALRLGPGCIRDSDRFNAAISKLVGAGWAAPIDGGMKLDGKQYRHVWRIVPATDGR
jgi:hypothetical protein